MAPTSRRRILVYLAVGVLATSTVLGIVAAATFTSWGYLLPPQHGLYAPGQSTFGALTINNTSVSLPHNGSWYSIGFFSNKSVTVFLNVSGGNGQLGIYNLSGLGALVNNQSIGLPLYSNVSNISIVHPEVLFQSYDYWVFMNTGNTGIKITFNFKVI